MLAEEQKTGVRPSVPRRGDGHFRCQCFLFPYFHVSYPFFSAPARPCSGTRVCDFYEHTTQAPLWQVCFSININKF